MSSARSGSLLLVRTATLLGSLGTSGGLSLKVPSQFPISWTRPPTAAVHSLSFFHKPVDVVLSPVLAS